eukprot:Hpha_TRINITY_DN1758_c0_g1::TRINITY_DN1758_c0_g1_i1::g.158402::m.158402
MAVVGLLLSLWIVGAASRLRTKALDAEFFRYARNVSARRRQATTPPPTRPVRVPTAPSTKQVPRPKRMPSTPSPSPAEPVDLPFPGSSEFDRRAGFLFPLGRMGFDQWRPVLEKLQSGGKEVTIVVLGGSETAGTGCSDPDGSSDRACAWPARYERLLHARFPAANLTLHNHAIGGTTIASAIPLVPSWFRHHAPRRGSSAPGGVDLVLVDFTVNDCIDFHSRNEELAGAYEAFVRAVHKTSPSTVLLFFHTIPVKECTHVRHIINHVAARYGDSVVSYADFSIFLEQQWAVNRTRFWRIAKGSLRATHPVAGVHKLMAETLAWATDRIVRS